MKKTFLTVLLASFLTLSMGACSNNEQPSTSEPTSSTTTPTTTPTSSTTEEHTHTVGDHGFCTGCGAYLGVDNGAFHKLGDEFRYESQVFTITGNNKYFERISGGHSGHHYYIEDGNPIASFDEALKAFTFIDGVATPAALDGETAINLGSDGHLYIEIDPTKLSSKEGVFYHIGEKHVIPNNALGNLHICEACHKFVGETKQLDSSFQTTILKGKETVQRVILTEDTDYGIITEFNESTYDGLMDVYTIVDNSPVKIKSCYDYDVVRLSVPEGNDGCLYLVSSYAGELESVTFENILVSSLAHGYDKVGFFFGKLRDTLGSFDLEDALYRLNGKYVVGIEAVQPVDEYALEISVENESGDALPFSVYQWDGAKIAKLDLDPAGWYDQISAEPVVIEIDSDLPGSQIDVTVSSHAIVA